MCEFTGSIANKTKEHFARRPQEDASPGERILSTEKILSDYSEALQMLGNLKDKYAGVGRISAAANGSNRAGITFQRFVLAGFLDEALSAASMILHIMSNGRYTLQRVAERVYKRTAGGLDLEVYDSYTGITRPVSTLSEGESFLASFSLALGLADVVQAYAGGIRLDTIFVDEGFGSLDPEALELAFRALLDLQRSDRLVGIIYHIADLKERINTRLEGLSGRSSSTVRFTFRRGGSSHGQTRIAQQVGRAEACLL